MFTLPERARGHGEAVPDGVHGDAVRQREEELREGVPRDVAGPAWRSEGDVRDEAEGQREERLDEREEVPDDGPAAGDEVVVRHVECIWRGQGERVGRHEEARGDRADVVRL